MKARLALFALLLIPAAAFCQEAPKTYATGYKPVAPEVKKAQIRKTGWVQFARATAPTWDCRQLGLVPPVVNQSDCGSCWDFAGSGIVTSAFIKAGYAKADGSFRISEQYTLDCGRNGGCNGDDHSSVFNLSKATGLPTQAEYGPYQAREGRCKDTSGMKMYKIADWGYCDPHANGAASTQSIKDAMVQYGPISVAIAANNAFMNVRPDQVFAGNSQNINHEVILVGWDDKKGRNGAWILRNSWGVGWCDSGYCWIEYGANGVGTDAAWVTVAPLPPPPPGPTPPPVPGAAPQITSALTAAGSVGTAFSFQITATNNPTSFGAAGLPPGLTVDGRGEISGAPTLAGTWSVVVSATNAHGAGVAALQLVVTGSPGPVPPGSVTITLTPEQVRSVIEQSGVVVVTPGMTLKDVAEALNKSKSAVEWKPMPRGEPIPAPKLEQEVGDLKRAVDAIMKLLISKEKK